MNQASETLLFVASTRGNALVVSIILSKAYLHLAQYPHATNPLIAAIQHGYAGIAFQLIAGDPNFEMTEPILNVVAGNPRIGEQVRKAMLTGARLPRITLETMIVMLQQFDDWLMELMLARAPYFQITEGILKAAAGNARCNKMVMRMLLARDRTVGITKAIAMAAARNSRRGELVM